MPILKNKQIVLVGGGILMLGVVGYAVKLVFFPPTLKDVARQTLDCARRADADCLYRYVHEDERKRLGLTPDKLRKLLTGYVSPAYQGFTPTGEVIFHASEGQGLVSATQVFTHADGRTANMLVRAQRTDSGITCSPIVSALVFSVFSTKPKSSTAKPGLETISFWKSSIQEDEKSLKDTGISGFVQDGPQGQQYTWESYRLHCDDLLARNSH